MTVPTLALPDGFATDSTFSAPAKAWDGATSKIIPPLGVVASGFVPGELRKPEYDNYLFASLIEHARKALDFPVANWSFAPTNTGFSGVWADVTSNGGSTWCIVGEAGEIQTTSTLLEWTRRTAGSGFADDFTAVCLGNGLFVAVGENGEIQTSPDGVTWTHRTAGSSYTGTFADVIWSAVASLFIAVGAGGEIQTSPTGVTWTTRATGSGYVDNFSAVAESGSEIVAIGAGVSNNVQRSTNGTSWTAHTRAGTRIAYGGGLFVITPNGSGSMYTSPTGVTWTTRSIAGTPTFTGYGIAYDGERNYVAIGLSSSPIAGTAVYTSPDATTWTRREHAFEYSGAINYFGLVFARGRWVIGCPLGVMQSLVLG